MNELQAVLDVVYGTYVDYERTIIPDFRSPEYILLQKEKLNSLSKEAKELIDIIEGLPNEMFLKNGRVKLKDLRRYARNELKWSWKIIELSISEVYDFIKES